MELVITIMYHIVTLFIPVHVKPFPAKPVLHVHVNDPTVS